MDDEQRKIYQTDGDRYEALIAREDYQGNIPRAKSVCGFDISPEMLRVCRDRLIKTGVSNWQVHVADHRKLPVDDGSADLVVSGWSVSYLAVWNEGRTGELDVWFAEMKRVLQKDGVIILFESLGTGNESPIRLEHVESTYRWLEANEFRHKWIRTDYRFESVDEAAELAGFFFGEELADRVREKRLVVLPECTGVWWKSCSTS